jgi:GDP-L-fucose synthase
MEKNSLIFIANHEGFIGSAICRKLIEKGHRNLLLKTKKELNLADQKSVEIFFAESKPEYVFLPSAKEGGISANVKYPADFIYQNIICQANIIDAAFKYSAKKLLFLGSACSYPKKCRQPIREDSLLLAPVEKTSEPYAIAKISGIKMCESYNQQHKTNFISAVPTNSYGPNDNFSEDGHVVAGLIKKFHQAQMEKNGIVKVWGTGKPKREFIFIDDLAEACIFLMENYHGKEMINIAGGKEFSIKKIASLIKKTAGFKGKIIFETEKPDGMPRRILDSCKISKLGWQPKTEFKKGLEITYQWYKTNIS